MKELRKKIQNATQKADTARAEIDAQNAAAKRLEEAEAELATLAIEEAGYKAQKKKRLSDLAKLEKVQEKNIIATLQALQTAWDLALLEVVALRDAAQLDTDKDMPRRYTLFGQEHFGSVEYMLASIENRESNLFSAAGIKSRSKRYKEAEAQGIAPQNYPRYP